MPYRIPRLALWIWYINNTNANMFALFRCKELTVNQIVITTLAHLFSVLYCIYILYPISLRERFSVLVHSHRTCILLLAPSLYLYFLSYVYLQGELSRD